jgi:hypothetical protein
MIVTASRQEQFESALRRHGAQLSRLRGPRGLVCCVLPGHDDRSASLSLDLTAAVFHCFGCGRSGGLKALLEFLGESPTTLSRRARLESDLQSARRAAMQRERAAAARRAEWEPLHFVSGYVGRCFRAASRARGFATGFGSDDPRTWPLLERAAHVELEGLNAEAQLDSILAEGRLT